MSDGLRQKRSALDRLREHILEMPGYEPVEPIDVMAKRLGIPEDEIVKLDANENQYGPSPKVRERLAEFDYYHIYPDPAQTQVREAVARYAGVEPEQVVLGSGSDELLDLCARLFLSPVDVLVNAPPTFGIYEFLGQVYGARVVSVPRREDFGLDMPALEEALRDGAKLVYLASPNNPTGNALPSEDLKRLLDHDVVVVVDEAYAEFAGESFTGMVSRHDNLIAVRTFSKWAGLAGLRAGYAVVPGALVEITWRVKVPYNLNVAAEQAILASLEDTETLLRNVEATVRERERMSAELAALGWLRPYPSHANFVLCEVRGADARDVHERLRERGILVRYFDTSGIQNCLRISTGRPEHTDRLIEALREIGGSIGQATG